MAKFKTVSELFKHVKNTREPISQLSGEPILYENHFQHHWCYLHILSKNSHTLWRTDERNIILGTVEEHENQESNETFKLIQAAAKRRYMIENEGKNFPLDEPFDWLFMDSEEIKTFRAYE